MKRANRILACLLLAALMVSLVPSALADTPNPIPVLSDNEIMDTPAGIHHYMLICLDSWDTDQLKDKWTSTRSAWTNHTDGLMLVTVDEVTRRVMLTSFIRDMLIMRPDGKFGRINNFLDGGNLKENKGGGWAYQNQKNEYEGIEALIGTINSHFGLRIEKYIVVNFKMVENIIDAVGGVDITVTSREASYLRNYPISSTSTTPAMAGAGTYHFSGHAAVIYMRIRKRETAPYVHDDGKTYSDTQDYGRTYRDRVVLTTIADSLKDISTADAFKLLDVIITNTVHTNMTTDDLFSALDLALSLKGTPVENIRMPVNNPVKQNSKGEWYEITPTLSSYNKNNYSYCECSVDDMATKQINYVLNREALYSFLFGEDWAWSQYIVVDDE